MKQAFLDFINATTLTAGQQIILAVITAVVTTSILFVLSLFAKNIGRLLKSFFLAIYKRLFEQKIKTYTNNRKRRSRYKKGNLSFDDMIILEEKVANGEKLTPLEEKAYVSVLEMKEELAKNLKSLNIGNIRLPEIPKI